MFDYNIKHVAYNRYHFSIKKREKMSRLRFFPNVVTVCFKEKARFDSKNNQKNNKLTIFELDIISKINCIMLVIILYILLGLGLRKV